MLTYISGTGDIYFIANEHGNDFQTQFFSQFNDFEYRKYKKPVCGKFMKILNCLHCIVHCMEPYNIHQNKFVLIKAAAALLS